MCAFFWGGGGGGGGTQENHTREGRCLQSIFSISRQGRSEEMSSLRGRRNFRILVKRQTIAMTKTMRRTAAPMRRGKICASYCKAGRAKSALVGIEFSSSKTP